jgi:hypothetical protein
MAKTKKKGKGSTRHKKAKRKTPKRRLTRGDPLPTPHD